MAKEEINNIEKEAESLLKKSGSYRIPVPIDNVAEYLELQTSASRMEDNMSGLLVVENHRGAIAYNSSHSPVRQRFTVAHEIGHYVLHAKTHDSRLFLDKYVVYRDDASTLGSDCDEVEANAFAAALLMPAKFVRREIDRGNLNLDDDDDLRSLAKRFNVSSMAMSFRLVNLGLLRSS